MADPLFTLIIDDTSPIVSYSPFADTFSTPNTASGWNPYYTDSGFAQFASGAGSDITAAVGNGTSLHLTACDGAFMQISWNGTSPAPHLPPPSAQAPPSPRPSVHPLFPLAHQTARVGQEGVRGCSAFAGTGGGLLVSYVITRDTSKLRKRARARTLRQSIFARVPPSDRSGPRGGFARPCARGRLSAPSAGREPLRP